MPSLNATPADHTASHAMLGLTNPTPRGSEPEMTPSADPLNELAWPPMPSVDPLNELASFLKWYVPCEAEKD